MVQMITENSSNSRQMYILVLPKRKSGTTSNEHVIEYEDEIDPITTMEYVQQILKEGYENEHNHEVKIQLETYHPVSNLNDDDDESEQTTTLRTHEEKEMGEQMVVTVSYNHHQWTCRIWLRDNMIQDSKRIAAAAPAFYGHTVSNEEQSMIATCSRHFHITCDPDPYQRYDNDFQMILLHLSQSFNPCYTFNLVQNTITYSG